MKPEIWAIVSDTEWSWVFGEPPANHPDLTFKQMTREHNRDAWSCVVNGMKLVVPWYEVTKGSSDSPTSRIRPLPGRDDKPFVGFENLPEPEFGTGWDDFDWSN